MLLIRSALQHISLFCMLMKNNSSEVGLPFIVQSNLIQSFHPSIHHHKRCITLALLYRVAQTITYHKFTLSSCLLVWSSRSVLDENVVIRYTSSMKSHWDGNDDDDVSRSSADVLRVDMSVLKLWSISLLSTVSSSRRWCLREWDMWVISCLEASTQTPVQIGE